MKIGERSKLRSEGSLYFKRALQDHVNLLKYVCTIQFRIWNNVDRYAFDVSSVPKQEHKLEWNP